MTRAAPQRRATAAGVRVLLADDEPSIALTLGDALEEQGFEVRSVRDTGAALSALEEWKPDVVISDIRMPGAGGIAVLKRSRELDPERPVLLMTGYATIDQAVEAMQAGALNYVQKPFRNESVLGLVAQAARLRGLEAENERLREQLSSVDAGLSQELIGRSRAMLSVFERIRTVAPTEATVLIQGESGTGKERVAKAIHQLSARAAGPFVALSCAALPESLLEAELFGHERGAFTDAHKERKGRFELADHGTLFLDDIDDMPRAMQVKFLRVLQERNFERLGGETTRSIDIRVIAATKVPLREEVRAGRFREDLYYRIHVVPVLLPPLREREGDVQLLAEHLIARHGGGKKWKLSDATRNALERYPWPGNVRELENAIQRAIALGGADGELAREHLLPLDTRWRGATEPAGEVRPLHDVLREAEREHIARALSVTGGHRTQTAELLGISRKVLWEKLRDLGLDDGKKE
jgi:DNA-binding NtrC family response regulator